MSPQMVFTPSRFAIRMKVGISVACTGTISVAMIDHRRIFRPGKRLRARAYAAIEAVSRTTTTEITEYRTEFKSQVGNAPTEKIRVMFSKVSDVGNAYGIVGSSAGEKARTTTASSGATVKKEITMSEAMDHRGVFKDLRLRCLPPGPGFPV
ncbi:hypothetical protein GCM10027403_36910 [Arthrobacter tecti]